MKDQPQRNTLETREKEKLFQQLLYDVKTNQRIFEIKENQEDNKNYVKKLLTEMMSENFPNIKKVTNIQICDKCRKPNSMTKEEIPKATLYSELKNSNTRTKIFKS